MKKIKSLDFESKNDLEFATQMFVILAENLESVNIEFLLENKIWKFNKQLKRIQKIKK